MIVHNIQEQFTEIGSNPIKNALSFLLIPNSFIERIISTFSSKLSDLWYFVSCMFQKPIQFEELASLQNTVDTLNRQMAEEKSRSKRMERLWKFSNSLTEVDPSFKFVPARVISIEPTDWFRYITIDKGKEHGLSADMAVITQSIFPPPKSVTTPVRRTKQDNVLFSSQSTNRLMTGAVIGKIKSVQPNSAKVQLITDRLSVVAATIGPLRDLVLIKGKPEVEKCTIDEIPSTTHDMLYEGDAVIVDERSSIFPPGMLVGWISSINRETQFCHIEVKPAFSFSRLREVLVLLKSEKK